MKVGLGYIIVEVYLADEPMRLGNGAQNILLVRPEIVKYCRSVENTQKLLLLASAEGKPASVMDMYFANQALSAEYMVKNADKLGKTVYSVPTEIDNETARIKLEAMGVGIDVLTEEQVKYLNSWEEGK